MIICAYQGCSNNSRDFPELRYIAFPKDPDLRLAWEKCSEPSHVKQRHMCNEHFHEESFRKQDVLLRLPLKKWKLNPGVVPIPPDTPGKTDGLMDARIRKKIVEEALEQYNAEPDPNFIEVKIEQNNSDPLDSPMLPFSTVSSKCRLCLEDLGSHAEELFEERPQHEYGAVAQHLNVLMQIQMEDSFDLPSSACENCIQTLESIQVFKDKILASQLALRPHSHDNWDQPLKYEAETEVNEFQESHDNYPILEETTQDESTMELLDDGCSSVAQDGVSTYGEGDISELEREDSWPTKESAKLERRKLRDILLQLDILKCQICQQSFRSFERISAHNKAVHLSSTTAIPCCNTTIRGLASLKEHLKFHLDPDTFKCKLCGAQFESQITLLKHRKTDHEADKLICQVCGKLCSSLTSLKQHENTHLRPSKCPHCSKAFVGPADLRRHVERVHDVMQRVVCDICGKGYSNQNTLWTHMKLHAIIRRDAVRKPKGRNVRDSKWLIACRLCDTRTGQIVGHVRSNHKISFVPTETEAELTPCETCGKMVPLYKMYRHCYFEHTRQPYECTICKQVFKKYDTLQAHMDGHLNRKYPCPHCEKVNRTQQGRRLHIKSNHPEEYAKIARKRVHLPLENDNAE